MSDTSNIPHRGLTDEDDIRGLGIRCVRLADGRNAQYVTSGDPETLDRGLTAIPALAR